MKDTYLSIIRHVLTAVGAFVVARGIATDAVVQEIIGAVSSLTGLIWGAYDEYVAAKKLKAQPPAVQAALK